MGFPKQQGFPQKTPVFKKFKFQISILYLILYLYVEKFCVFYVKTYKRTCSDGEIGTSSLPNRVEGFFHGDVFSERFSKILQIKG